EVKIKWPNDIYVDDKKIAGILINNSINGNSMQSSIIGIGININQTKFLSDAPNPVSLKKLKRKEINLDKCLIRLLDHLNLRFRQLLQNNLEEINQEYLSRLYRYKTFANYIIDGNKIKAKIVGLDQYGKLCLKTKDLRTYTCDLKEVKFII
ncbi:MAG: biotin--[acetyl-CoA-carboxylase] ligase, partial [Clostridia bacterium]|nr:biotin--[acetyl-CoA-carboxylase] ligase [Clostridia bacterium]